MSIVSKPTIAEAYKGTDWSTVGVELEFISADKAAMFDFAVYQNEPNPFKGSSIIGFMLPEAD